MDLAVAGVVLLAASIHPLRELILKGTVYPEAAYLGVILVWLVIAVVHGTVLGVDFTATAKVVPLVLISTAGLVFYYFGTLTAMKTGDLSIYYPIIRAAPLFIVAGGWLVLGQSYGPVMLLGVGLVMVGAFFLQYKPGARLLAQPPALAAAVLAMSAMAMQSLSDSEAVRIVQPPALLASEYVILIVACVTLLAIRKPAGRPVMEHLFGGWRRTPMRYLGAAVTSYASYYLILVSYQMGGNVAAVSCLRQFSIPLSVVLGGYVLKESDTRNRLLWALVLAVGIVIVILSR